MGNTCGKKCLGKASCVKDCMKSAEGYSDGCASCFGDTASCTASKCWSKCIGGDSPACDQCAKDNCDPALLSCSGLTPPTAVAAAAGACTNDADQQVWTSNGKANFKADMNTCGKKCMGRSSCV